jgi:hypothetical protein
MNENEEERRMWEEVVIIAYFRVLLWHFAKRTEQEILAQQARFLNES